MQSYWLTAYFRVVCLRRAWSKLNKFYIINRKYFAFYQFLKRGKTWVYINLCRETLSNQPSKQWVSTVHHSVNVRILCRGYSTYVSYRGWLPKMGVTRCTAYASKPRKTRIGACPKAQGAVIVILSLDVCGRIRGRFCWSPHYPGQQLTIT